jgi:hypothetical protein
MEKLSLPGGIHIHGVKALIKDPADFGMYSRMRTSSYAELAEAGTVIAGSPETVRDQLVEYCKTYGIGNLHAMLGFGSMPKELVEKNVTLFATEVLPHLRKIWQEDGFTHHWWPKRLGGSPRSTTQKVEVQAS